MLDDFDIQIQCEEFYDENQMQPQAGKEQNQQGVGLITPELKKQQKDLDWLYARIDIALVNHGEKITPELKRKLVLAKAELGAYLDQKFPIMERALLLGMVAGQNQE